MNLHRFSSHGAIRGSSWFDILCIGFAFFVCALLANSAIQFLRGKSEDSRLHSSVQAINRAIYLFKTTGGDLSDALTPDQVIAKMQAAENDEFNLRLHAVLDATFEPVYESPEEVRTRAERAFWNTEKQAFEILETPKPGIKAFRESS